jgi:hypothetical protein
MIHFDFHPQPCKKSESIMEQKKYLVILRNHQQKEIQSEIYYLG